MQDPPGSVKRGAPAPGLPDDGDRAAARRLARGFGALVLLTAALITLGALVRAHGAGLACPDWPLCFGELVPRFDFHVAFEVGHRYVAGTLALLFVTLAVATVRRGALRAEAGPLLLAAAALLGVQVVLGGFTVLHLLASWTVTSHLLTGNAFAATLLLVSRRLADVADPPPPRAAAPPGARAALVAAAALLLLQIALGGLVSSNYAGLACPEWPTCRDGVFAPSLEGAYGLHLAHRWNAVGVAAAFAAAALLARRDHRLARRAALVAALALAQVAVGVANVLYAIPVEITALHSAIAAGLVLTTTLTLREAWLRPAPARDERLAAGLARAR